MRASLNKNQMAVAFTTDLLNRRNGTRATLPAQLLYHCSHRMSAPLKTIQGLLNVMEIVNDPSQKKICMDMITDCICQLQDLRTGIEQILMNEERGVCHERISLGNLFNEIEVTFDNQIRSAGIIIGREIAPSFELFSDNSRLRLLLMQLLANAITFCDNSKAEKTVMISAHIRGTNVSISVEDNGIGIEESALPGLFKAFFRGSEKSGGPGLGLFLANALAEKLGAALTVESVVGRGTAVTITIPG